MRFDLRTAVRRAARVATGCLLGGALTIPLGPSTTSQSVDRLNSMSTRPMPSTDPRPVVREQMIWVPDRHIRIPGTPGEARVPGHWERLTPEGRYYVPPVGAVDPTGGVTSFPAGTYPPPAERPYGP